MKLALKVDVDTYRGTREGVPRLLEALERHRAGATFLFSLGPDHTGRAIKRVFRRGFVRKATRTSVLRHYGIATLLYGTLLPGPDIGRRCADVMRQVRDQGFEVGIHCWDHVKWQDGVAAADPAWVESQMSRACDRFTEIFAEAPRAHGAAGWQMNRHAFRLTQRLGFDYASDTRGWCPFIPMYDAEIIACPQIPTTLPTLDELIGRDGCTADNVHESLLALAAARLDPAQDRDQRRPGEPGRERRHAAAPAKPPSSRLRKQAAKWPASSVGSSGGLAWAQASIEKRQRDRKAHPSSRRVRSGGWPSTGSRRARRGRSSRGTERSSATV